MARKALLIGTGKYDSGYEELHSPPTDLQLMRNVLELQHVGFELEREPLLNPDYLTAGMAVEQFFEKSWREDDLLLYLTGHGIVEKGVYYYILRDTRPDAIRTTALSKDFLVSAFKARSTKSATIIVDTCNAGMLGRMGVAEAPPLDFSGLAGEGRTIICAGPGTSNAYERPDPCARSEDSDRRYYSLFTSAICLGWRLGRNAYGRVLRPAGLTDYAQQVVANYSAAFEDHASMPSLWEREPVHGGAVLADLDGAGSDLATAPDSGLQTFFDRLRLAYPDWDFPPAADRPDSMDLRRPSEQVDLPADKKMQFELISSTDSLSAELDAASPKTTPRVIRDERKRRHWPTITWGVGNQEPDGDGWIEIWRSDFLGNLVAKGVSAEDAAAMVARAIEDRAIQENGPYLRVRMTG